ncbi:O-antigen ligase family protein [Microterricola viridarii]|uniref:Exopolysaccharide production protein n=1 Tax=Microterricola viridarii TaxID=412690 RepID=A0A0Y0N1P1_9MICO|nr:O-antigen ligase family protein [Microterricola viridarii]AMB57852.1 exopolysaccharide production protein [Microterricola viridarii]
MMQPGRSRFAVHTLATALLFTALAGQFWRNLLGWWGWGALVLLLLAASVVALLRLKPEWLNGRTLWRRTPVSLWLFLGLAVLSLAWSFYPGATAVGILAQLATTVPALLLGLCLTWPEFLRALGAALRWLLGLSLLFELWVAVFVGGPVLPFFTDYEGKIPAAFYWSRGLLFQGGPIEGIVANRNLLAAAALLALIVFAAQLAARTVRRGPGIAWLAIAVLTLGLTRSATVLIAAVVVAVALGFALWARRVGPERRRPVYLTAGGLVVVGGVFGSLLWGPLLGALGKSEDLTGRFDIWSAVTELASQRPVAGWGWVSYWAPWVEPFDDLAVRKGVTYLQAHSAWLDVWLQLGVIGVVLFAALVIGTLWRSWFLAVDRPRDSLADDRPYAASALVPFLLMIALLVQSFTESRILIEGGWMMLVALALITKRNLRRVETMP